MPEVAQSAPGRVWEYFADAGGPRWAEVASGFGRLVAQGVMDHAECYDAMLHASRARRPAMDEIGRSVRLAQALHDATLNWQGVRDRTRFGIRRALAPMLVARAASARLLAAAHAVNAEAGDPLLPREVHAEVVREVYWAARRLGRVGVAS